MNYPAATKLKTQVDALVSEVSLVRSLVISLIGRDEEGEYRPDFVKKAIKTAQEKPLTTLRSRSEFLKQIS